MTKVFGLPILILANFSLAFLGLLLPFGAVQADSNAPWTQDVRLFMLGLSAVLIGAVLVAALLALLPYTRGSRGYLLATSIAALLLPVASAMTYRWYLFDVANGTIGGAVGFQLGAAAILIGAVGLVEGTIAAGVYSKRPLAEIHS